MSEFQDYLDLALPKVKFDAEKDDSREEYDIVKEVQELLVYTRTRLDISQKELSERTGISETDISNIETGRSVPSLAELKCLTDGMGKRLVIDFVKEDYFMGI